MGGSLDPTLLHRISSALRPDFTRTVLARRIAAGGLVMLAGIAALRPDPADSRRDVIVAAYDLSPGIVLTADDVRTVTRAAGTLPEGALTGLPAVVGATLAGPTRGGEVLTDARVLGPRSAALTAGPNARIVPLRLADAAVLDLIRPGDVVDVLAAPSAVSEIEPRLVAANAVVVLASAKQAHSATDRERVVLVALPAAAANALAGATLVETVTLTIH